MKTFSRPFSSWLALSCLCLLTLTGHFGTARAQASLTPSWTNGFVVTNGAYVTVGGNLMIATNSPSNTDEYKQFVWRVRELNKIMDSKSSNAPAQYLAGSRALIQDYPDRLNGYQNIMEMMDDYEYEGELDKSRALANELMSGTGPENVKLWAKGYLHRLDSFNRPVTLKFTAEDGRAVDLARLKGKVVLVDFWATTCGPCVKELPRVKAAFDKFHDQGLEVIGVSCDTDQERLNKYLKEKDLPWPQYCDAKGFDNQLSQDFGIDGIPHMFLIDKKGILRFDNVRANDRFHAKNDTTSIEEKITKLLAEE